MNPFGISTPATPDLQAITIWTLTNERAKADYYAHPISSCHVSGCDRLAADAYTCGGCKQIATMAEMSA